MVVVAWLSCISGSDDPLYVLTAYIPFAKIVQIYSRKMRSTAVKDMDRGRWDNRAEEENPGVGK
ncbi:hypothetical protein D3C87_960390 [compost metagenome]